MTPVTWISLPLPRQYRETKSKILVAVADVDSLVKNGSAIDEHARHNTTSVYTAAQIFPMLPEKLSTNLTSLNFNEDRLSIVVEMADWRATDRFRIPISIGRLSAIMRSLHITALLHGWKETELCLRLLLP